MRSDRGWYDNHRCHYKAIGISRLWKSTLENYEKDILHLYMCIEVPEYAIRLNNMTLDERIRASIVMEKFSRVGNSFEDAEEKDIFKCGLSIIELHMKININNFQILYIKIMR